MANRDADAIAFKIVKHIGVIATYDNGWAKELNIVSWNDAVPKFDIRDWSPDHARMTRGITLHENEARSLMNVLATI